MQRWSASGWKLPALSGTMLGLAYYAPVPLLNLAAFIPLLYWLESRPASSRYAKFKAGFVFGLVTHLITLHFVYAILPYTWLVLLLYVAFASALALRISCSIVLLGWLRERTGLSWAVLLPICWIPLEWLQSFGDLRMTGDHLAHTLAGYPFLIQFADITGHYGVGTFMLAVNGLLYDTLVHRGRAAGRRAVVALAILLSLVLGYDLWAWNRPAESTKTLRIAIVQPNIDLGTKRDGIAVDQQSDRLASLTRQSATQRPELIVWPETARPTPLFHWLDQPRTFAMPEVQALASEVGAPILAGVEYVQVRSPDDYDLFNAALLTRAGGVDPAWAAKVYLVPFVEATPFRAIVGPLIEGRGGEWKWLSGGFEPGPTAPILQVDGARIGVLVCYEQLFSDLARSLRNAGAQIQVVITNDAWFGRSVFQRFQADVVRLRAIENRSAFVRVANTGISGFVDSRGRYRGRTGLFESAIEVEDVERTDRRTLYNRVGDAVVGLLLLALVCVVGLALGAGGRGRISRS